MASSQTTPIPQSAEDITPSWVQQVLQRDLPGVIITDVNMKGSISQGEGNMSDIIAFDALGTRNGSSQSYSLVAKLTDFARLQSIVKDYGNEAQIKAKEVQIKLEEREVEFYSGMVPELLSVHAKSTEIKSSVKDVERRPPADSFLLPKCYFTATDPTSTVSVRVMENLKSHGFSIKADQQPLSREEMMLTVGALAQLHGLSHRLELHVGRPLSEKYAKVLATSPFTTEDIARGYQYGVKKIASAFPDQADLVTRLENVNLQTVILDAKETSSRPKVLNHGDGWVNNIMIKYEGEVPVALKLVDWQVIQYLPPTCDLALIFCCSASWDAFHNHRDDILAHYHQQLQKELGPNEFLPLKSYKLEQLKADFKVDCLHGLINYIFRLPALRTEMDLVQKIQEIIDWGLI